MNESHKAQSSEQMPEYEGVCNTTPSRFMGHMRKERRIVSHERRRELAILAQTVAFKIEQEVKVDERSIFFMMIKNLLSGEVR